MTYASDPPRLRTRAPALPTELELALESLPDEDASIGELEQLALSVHAAVAPAAPPAATIVRTTAKRWHRVAVMHGALGLILMFALGAGAAVLVVSGVFFGLRAKSRDEASPPSNITEPVPTSKTPAARPRAMAPPSPDSAPVQGAPAAPSPSADLGPSARDTPSSPPSELGAAAELALVGRAQAALETDAVKAFALASDHERKFPNGALAQERELIAIRALLALGRQLEAEARAARFRVRFPASVHARRLEVLLGTPPRSGR